MLSEKPASRYSESEFTVTNLQFLLLQGGRVIPSETEEEGVNSHETCKLENHLRPTLGETITNSYNTSELEESGLNHFLRLSATEVGIKSLPHSFGFTMWTNFNSVEVCAH